MDIDRAINSSGSAWLGVLIGSGLVMIGIGLAVTVFAVSGPSEAFELRVLLALASPLPALPIIGVLLYRSGRARTAVGLATGALLTLVALVMLFAWFVSGVRPGV